MIVLIGKGTKYTFSRDERECLEKYVDISEISECTKFLKIIYKGCRFTSNKYVRSKRTNDSVIITNNNEYGIISNICRIKYNDDFKVFIFFKRICLRNDSIVNNVNVPHFNRIDEKQKMDLNVIEYSMLYRPCMIVRSKKCTTW